MGDFEKTTNPEDENIEPTENNPEDEDLSIVEKIIGVYTSPVSTFKYLAKKPDFLWALIVLSLIGIALAVVTLPETIPLIQAQTIQQFQSGPAAGSPEETAVVIGTMNKAIAIGAYVFAIIGTPIVFAISWMLSCVLIYFIGMFMGGDVDFKRLFGVIPWISFVTIFSQVQGTVVGLTTDLVNVDQMKDMRIMRPLSLMKIIPESVDLPGWMGIVLGSIDPFFIWGVVLLVFAIEAVTKCKRQQAVITAFIVTLIGLAAAAGFGAIGLSVQARN